MSSRAQVLQKLLPIGSNVKIVTKNKDEYQGVVLEHGDDYLILKDVSGDESFVSYDDIGSGKRLETKVLETQLLLVPPPPLVPVMDAEMPKPEQAVRGMQPVPSSKPSEVQIPKPEQAIQVISPVPLSQAQEVQMPNLDSEVVKRLREIQKRFDDGTRFPKVGVRPPDFVFPAEELSGLEPKKEWERIKNMYDHARKMNELTPKYNRIQLITSGLKELGRRYPSSPSLKRQVAHFLLLAENVPDAFEYCRQAALTSHMASDWRNVAALAIRLDEGPQASYALDEVFKQNAINHDLDMWYLYVSLLRTSGDYSLLARFLDATRRILLPEEKQLLLETGIYVLLSTKREQIAQDLVCQQLKGNVVDTLVRSVCNHFKGPLSETFRRAISELNDTKEQQKKELSPVRSVQFERTADEVFKRAIMLANNEGEYAEAISELRQLLKLDPNYPEAAKLLEKWQAVREVNVPKGSKLFARAKRLQMVEKDYEGAIALFNKAIARNDKDTERAIKELFSLHMQLNEPDKAVSTLTKHQGKVASQLTVDIMFFGAYKKMNQYDQAIEFLSRCISNATTYGQKVDFHRQMGNCYLRLENYVSAEKWFREVIELENDNKAAQSNLAFCLIKQKRYDEAEQILKGILPDVKADELLKAVAEARATGQAAQIVADDIIEADDIIIDTTLDRSGEMSGFVRFFLDRCAYEGVRSDRVQERNFGRSDVQNLDAVASRLGARRPRERAEYYLSAAKIVSELVDDEWSGMDQMYKFLCRSFNARGDAAVLEGKPLEVIRECYCEALSAYDRSKAETEAIYALVRYLFSLLGHTQIPMTSSIPTMDETLEKIFSLQLQKDKIFDAIAYLVYRSKLASRNVLRRLYENPEFRELAREYLKSKDIVGPDGASGLEEFVQQWNELQRRNVADMRVIATELGSIAKVELTTASVENSLKRIRAVERRIFFDLDRQRVSELQRILELISDLSKQAAFEEQEHFCKQIGTRCQNLLESIERDPTTLSVEVLHQIIKIIQEKITKRLEEIYESSVPQLTLRLPIESYSRNDNQKIEVQVVVENKMGCSPAESLGLIVQEDEEFFTVGTQEIKPGGSLRGGEQEILRVPIQVTEQAYASQAFTLSVHIQYRTRSSDDLLIFSDRFSIKLYSSDQFKHIENPYTAYASGSIVSNEEMFYGRAELISNIFNAICREDSQSKSIIIFGQKRSGKSSILYHLKRKLEQESKMLVLDVGNIGSMLDNQSKATLLYKILWGIVNKLRYALEDEEEKGDRQPLKFSFPSDKEFYEHPDPLALFKDLFERFRRIATRTEGWHSVGIVLLIDEFSYIYEKIVSGDLSPDFMKNWKALLQENFFSVVLVGQDVMPKFKERFPNEFGIIQDERVSYLKSDDAIRLIDEPIRVGGKQGKSRYREKAIARILDLTAGCPYYIQIFCNRLVEYMNSKCAELVTEANVDQVKNDLIQGANPLSEDNFDNLVSSGDTSSDAIVVEDAKIVLTMIAKNSRTGLCSMSNILGIADKTKSPVKAILDDLEKREVIECKEGQYYRIRVGLFKEWLVAH